MSAYLTLIDWQRSDYTRPYLRTPFELRTQQGPPRPVEVRVWQIAANAYGTVFETTVSADPGTISQALAYIGQHLPSHSRIFSVHTRSLLGRLGINWGSYRGLENNWLNTAEFHDVIELLNTPAVLSLPERELWSPAYIEWATGIRGENPMEQLFKLCIPHLSIPRISPV